MAIPWCNNSSRNINHPKPRPMPGFFVVIYLLIGESHSYHRLAAMSMHAWDRGPGIRLCAIDHSVEKFLTLP